MCHKAKQVNLGKRLLEFEFTESVTLPELREQHQLALDRFRKNITDSQFDCEYETMAIWKHEQKKIEEKNAEKRKRKTHNH